MILGWFLFWFKICFFCCCWFGCKVSDIYCFCWLVVAVRTQWKRKRQQKKSEVCCRKNKVTSIEKRGENKKYDIHVCAHSNAQFSLRSSNSLELFTTSCFQKCNSTKCASFSDDWFCSLFFECLLCFAILLQTRKKNSFNSRNN